MPTEILPKLDYSKGLPSDTADAGWSFRWAEQRNRSESWSMTWKMRLLGNQDPNLHYALLTDLPDSTRAAA